MKFRHLFAAASLAAISLPIASLDASAAFSTRTCVQEALAKKKQVTPSARSAAKAKCESEADREAAKLKRERAAKQLVLKKKKDAAQSASARPCTGFMNCLFGTKRGVRVSRDPRVQTASFAGTKSIFAKKTRQTVAWTETRYKPGSLVVKTPERALYYVLGNGKAIRYSVGVGREGFQWSGNSKIVAKQEWPSWTPPKVMIEREAAKGHIIPPFMEGGPGNPLGARALYIGGTMFRVHGTNNEASIGGAVSSGCIRMMNADVIDLYERVKLGAPIFVYQ
jgi:lipoprotein-anchoring transpeptidase ErfK/SrfK